MKFDPEFKRAISLLSSAEKDKLLLRLLKRDIGLANQLYFELLSTETVEERRSKMSARVAAKVQRMADNFYSMGSFLVDLRALSGDITEHVKTTKDKYGEISLNLEMLNWVFETKGATIREASRYDTYALNIYVIARAFKILILIKAMHEDYLVEFEEALVGLGRHFADNPHLMKMCIANGFDVNWLFLKSIPDDIAAILKNIRTQGLLK